MPDLINEFIDKHAIAICVVLAIAALIFIVYGHRHREQIQQLLKREFFTLPSTTIDYWSLSHFILYGIFGFLIPDRHLTFLLLGTAFEFAEDALSSKKTTQLVNCHKNPNNTWCNIGIDDDYWYMNYSDIYINIFGYIVGSAVRTTLVK